MPRFDPSRVRAVVDRLLKGFAAEFYKALYSTLLVTLLSFNAFGVRFDDVYARLVGTWEPTGDVVFVPIGAEALSLWNPADAHPDTTPRDLLAELVRVADEGGARVIALDFLLEAPTAGDEALRAAAARHGAVIAGTRVAFDSPGATPFALGLSAGLRDPWRVADPNGVQPAHANLYVEEPLLFTGDLVARGMTPALRHRTLLLTSDPTSWTTRALQTETRWTPSLAFASAWLFRARTTDPTASLATLYTHLADACTGERCAGTLPALAGVSTLDAPWRPVLLGDARANPLPSVSAADLLAEAAIGAVSDAPGPAAAPLTGRLKDKVVILGRVDAASDDRVTSAFGFPTFSSPDMPGALFQAMTIDALLSERRVRPLGWPWNLVLVAASAAAAAVAVRKLSAAMQLVAWLCASIAAVALGALTFRLTGGLVVNLNGPMAFSLIVLTVLHAAEGDDHEPDSRSD